MRFPVAVAVVVMSPTIAFAQTSAANGPRAHPVIVHNPPAESTCWDCAASEGVSAPLPPAGFNPLSASDEQLAHFGFPPRPDARTSPADYAFWARVVTLPVTRVAPKLLPTNIENRPNEVRSVAGSVSAGPQGVGSNNWSGYAVIDSNKPFAAKNTYVYASFVVPVAQQAFGTCSGTDYSVDWVGIDGVNSTDVLQAGIEADATCSGGVKSAYYSAWYEWYPNLEVRVTTPPVAPGDLIYVYVWNTSSTTADYYIANQTQGVSSSLAFGAPKGTALQGTSVEWIVERPTVNKVQSTLTNYVAMPWYQAHAVTPATSTTKSKEYSPGIAPTGTIYDLTMLDSSSKPISAGYATPDSALTYTDENGKGYFYTGSALWFFDEGSAS